MDKTCTNISDLFFQLEAAYYNEKESSSATRKWEDLLVKGETALEGVSSGSEEKVYALNQLIFGSEGYKSQVGHGQQFTLCGTLLDKGGTCLGLTTLFFCLGQALAVSVRPLLYENHIAITLEKTTSLIHFEMTQRGANLPFHRCSPQYGQPVLHHPVLDNEQFMAVHLSSRAALTLVPLKFYDDALFLLDAALELYPEYLAAHINRVTVLVEMDQKTRAMEALELAETFGPQKRFQQRINALREQL